MSVNKETTMITPSDVTGTEVTPMTNLLHKLETVDEGSRELDAEVQAYTVCKSFGIQDNGWRQTNPIAYTTSLDAALTLVPEGWGWMARMPFDGPPAAAYVSRSDGPTENATAATPALALCIAAIKARESGNER